MKTIELSQGKRALIDDDDYRRVSKFKWYYNNGYAKHQKTLAPNKRQMIWLHRYIIQPPSGYEVDHINGDRLDNRKQNLRICTHKKNSRNRKITGGSSKYKGVYLHGPSNKWMAYIKHNGKMKYLGVYRDESRAAFAYNIEARKRFKEFARLNLVEEKNAE